MGAECKLPLLEKQDSKVPPTDMRDVIYALAPICWQAKLS